MCVRPTRIGALWLFAILRLRNTLTYLLTHDRSGDWLQHPVASTIAPNTLSVKLCWACNVGPQCGSASDDRHSVTYAVLLPICLLLNITMIDCVETWSNVSMRLQLAGTKRSMVVSSLHPAVKYHIRLFAKNDIGVSQPSTVLRATTTEEGKIPLLYVHCQCVMLVE